MFYISIIYTGKEGLTLRNLTEGNISKNFLLFSIPAILSAILNQSYAVINTAVVGKALGDLGLAAIGATSSFATVLSSVIWGIATGIAIYVSSLFGAVKYKQMANAIKTNVWLITAISVIISVITIVCRAPVFSLLRIGEDIYTDAMIYFVIYMTGFAPLVLGTCFMLIYNATGNTSYPLIMSILSSVCNLTSNIILIAVLKKGVWASAVSTVATSILICICYVVKLHFDFKKFGVANNRISYSLKEILTAWKQALPCMVQQVAMYFSSFGVQPAINALGSASISAYSVCINVYNITAHMFQNSSRCLSSYCSQCIGSGNTDKLKYGIKIALRQSMFISLPVMAFCMLFPRQIVSMFYTDAFGESANLVVRYILICVPFIAVQIVNNMFHNFYRGVMKPTITLITTVVYSVVRIGATFALVGRFEMDGVYFGFIIAWVVELILSLSVYFSGKWKSKELEI